METPQQEMFSLGAQPHRCRKCQIEFNGENFYFYSARGKRERQLQPYCKACRRIRYYICNKRSTDKHKALESEKRRQRREQKNKEQARLILEWFGSEGEWLRYLSWKKRTDHNRSTKNSNFTYRKRIASADRRDAKRWDGQTCRVCKVRLSPEAFPAWTLKRKRPLKKNEQSTCLACYRETKHVADRVQSPRNSGYVYIIQTSISGAVKFGFVEKLESAENRKRHLQIGNHEKLMLLGVVAGGRTLEKRLHAKFAHRRADGGSEWFSGTDDVIACVRELITESVMKVAI